MQSRTPRSATVETGRSRKRAKRNARRSQRRQRRHKSKRRTLPQTAHLGGAPRPPADSEATRAGAPDRSGGEGSHARLDAPVGTAIERYEPDRRLPVPETTDEAAFSDEFAPDEAAAWDAEWYEESPVAAAPPPTPQTRAAQEARWRAERLLQLVQDEARTVHVPGNLARRGHSRARYRVRRMAQLTLWLLLLPFTVASVAWIASAAPPQPDRPRSRLEQGAVFRAAPGASTPRAGEPSR